MLCDSAAATCTSTTSRQVPSYRSSRLAAHVNQVSLPTGIQFTPVVWHRQHIAVSHADVNGRHPAFLRAAFYPVLSFFLNFRRCCVFFAICKICSAWCVLGTNDKGGSPSYIQRFVNPLSIKIQEEVLTDWKYAYMKH